MQNHMTQALVYSLMDYRPGLDVYGDVYDRLDVLQWLHEVYQQQRDYNNSGCSHLWLGQYSDYIQHLRDDQSCSHALDIDSLTPTAASVQLQHVSEDRGIRITFTAGKAMVRREMYITVANKNCNITYSIQPNVTITLRGDCWGRLAGVVTVPNGYQVLQEGGHLLCNWAMYDKLHGSFNHASDESVILCRDCEYCVLVLETVITNAYTTIIRSLLNGDRSMFVHSKVCLLLYRCHWS